MKSLFYFCIAAVLASLTSAYADTTQWSGAASIVFNGTSTLHSWSGKVTAEPFTANVTMNEAGQPSALKARVEVKATGMDTAEPDRDVKMRKSMKVTENPLIVGVMDTAFDKINAADGTPSKLPFALTLVGKTQQVNAQISKWSRKGDTATFDLDFDLSLKQCGIEVPSVLLVVRVGDTIKVHATVKLSRIP